MNFDIEKIIALSTKKTCMQDQLEIYHRKFHSNTIQKEPEPQLRNLPGPDDIAHHEVQEDITKGPHGQGQSRALST